MVLRTGADLVQLGERGELGLGQSLDHTRGEDRGVVLHGDAQQESDLIVEHITSVLGWTCRGLHNGQFLSRHRIRPPTT
jgi:hypothetical protein